MATVNTKTADEAPILDPELQEQLRLEVFGNNESIQPKNNTNIAGGVMVMGASILGLVGMQFPFLFIKHAPFMATPARKVRDALKFIDLNRTRTETSSLSSLSQSVRKSQSSKPPLFVDLGSGDGQAVYEAARLGYKAVGIEFNWTLWALSSFRRQFFWSPDVRRRSQFLLQDFSNYNLKDANTIMIFAVPRTMPILGRKIQSECSDGTTIMAYRFEMPLAAFTDTTAENNNGADDESTSSVNSENNNEDDDEDLRLRATCIYDQEEMRIYRMGK